MIWHRRVMGIEEFEDRVGDYLCFIRNTSNELLINGTLER